MDVENRSDGAGREFESPCVKTETAAIVSVIDRNRLAALTLHGQPVNISAATQC